MTDGPQRLQAVSALLETIYPGGRAAVRTRSGRTGAARTEHPPDGPWRSFRVVPSAARPRLLVPVDLPRAAGPALQRVSAIDRRRDVIGRSAVALLARSPVADRLLTTSARVGPVDARSVESYLAATVGAQVRLSVQIGAERANAKPVLGVYRVEGRLEVGFCKVGSSALAGRLVAHESATLQRLAAARLRTLDVPPVLHSGQWQGCELVLLGTVRGSRGAGGTIPYDAMREVAAVDGVVDVPMGASGWVASVRERLPAAGSRHAQMLDVALDALVERDDSRLVPHGSWHGDWGPWNMAWGSRPVVWDWERCASGVPVGMDAAHFVGHPPLRRIGEMQVALDALAGLAEPAVSNVLGPWVPASNRAAVSRAVVDAYLLELACRFAVDAAEVGTAPVEALATWYLQVAARRLETRLPDVRAAERTEDEAVGRA